MKISFKANIEYDKRQVNKALLADKKLDKNDRQLIMSLLDEVDSFKKMPEKSRANVYARVDKGQVNLICVVSDITGKIRQQVFPRSVRKFVEEEKFRKRFLETIKLNIQNVEKTRISTKKVKETLLKTKNIKGLIFTDLFGNQFKDFNEENIEKFLDNSSFSTPVFEAIEKGYDPKKRLIRLIKYIDFAAGKNPDFDFSIGITPKYTNKKQKRDYFVVLITNKNKENELKISFDKFESIDAREVFYKTVSAPFEHTISKAIDAKN